MIEVPLGCGGVALVDDVDAWVLRHLWNVVGGGYIARNQRAKTRTGHTTVRLHREIMQAPPGVEVDHINGDRLDNRRSNLRLCSRDENMRNRRMHRNNTSGLKGVSRHGRRWRAQLQVDGKKLHIGVFDTREEAHDAYRVFSKAHHGDFGNAGLNEHDIVVQKPGEP